MRESRSRVLFCMEEIWKSPLSELESYCQISNLGRVKYLDRVDKNGRNLKGFISSPPKNLLKYVEVSGPRTDVRKRYLLHRLVALAFLPNPLNLSTVNHINGIKSDNRVENLEWASYSENNQHAFDLGLRKYNHETTAKLSSKDVISMRLEIIAGARTVDMAHKYGIDRRSVVDIKYGRTWKHLLPVDCI